MRRSTYDRIVQEELLSASKSYHPSRIEICYNKRRSYSSISNLRTLYKAIKKRVITLRRRWLQYMEPTLRHPINTPLVTEPLHQVRWTCRAIALFRIRTLARRLENQRTSTCIWKSKSPGSKRGMQLHKPYTQLTPCRIKPVLTSASQALANLLCGPISSSSWRGDNLNPLPVLQLHHGKESGCTGKHRSTGF